MSPADTVNFIASYKDRFNSYIIYSQVDKSLDESFINVSFEHVATLFENIKDFNTSINWMMYKQ